MVFERIYWPHAFFITFSTYGTRLHGRDEGSVDNKHNQYGAPFVEANHLYQNIERRDMPEPPFVLGSQQREIVLQTIKDVCSYKKWMLFAAHIRTEHLHAVLSCDCKPEAAMNVIKSRATRMLREQYPDLATRKIWTRHGSTKYIWKREHVFAAIDYVVSKQGDPMTLYYDADYYTLPTPILPSKPPSEPRT